MCSLIGNIYWLASYPKSGNTWMRAFISSLRYPSSEPIDINNLKIGSIASSREWINKALDFDIDELTHDEADLLRPGVYRWLSEQMDTPQYHKIHDAYTYLANGDALIPSDASKGVIHIVRNPLDVAVSLAHYFNCSVDQAITDMADNHYCFAGNTHKFYPQLRQKLLSWSEHVTSWMEVTSINSLVVRYEDMKLNPISTFTKVAHFLELPSDLATVKQALSDCEIDKLQAQEKEKTFREKHHKAASFFRKGIVGDWQTALSNQQVQEIIQNHGQVMNQLGYLDQNNQVRTGFDSASERGSETFCSLSMD